MDPSGGQKWFCTLDLENCSDDGSNTGTAGNAALPKPRNSDIPGFALCLQEDNSWIISEAIWGHNVEKPDLFQMGDKLKSIDGGNVQLLTSTEVVNLLVLAQNIELEREGRDPWILRLQKHGKDGESADSRKPSDVSSGYEIIGPGSSLGNDSDNERILSPAGLDATLKILEPLLAEEWRMFLPSIQFSLNGNHFITGSLVVTNHRLGFVASADNQDRTPSKLAVATRRYASHSLSQGLVKGVTGLFTQPIAGAVENGIGGFMKGFGKGLIGMAVRPVSGVAATVANSGIGGKEAVRSAGISMQRWFKNMEVVSIPLAAIERAKRSMDRRQVEIQCKDTTSCVIEFNHETVLYDDKAGKMNASVMDVCVFFKRTLKSLMYVGAVDKSFAFATQDPSVNPCDGSWDVYSAFAEYERMGVNAADSRWRISDINQGYSLIPTYPESIVVPTCIDDETLKQSIDFRTRGRIPVLCWKSCNSQVAICRSSQPKSGPLKKRSVHDEELVNALAWCGERQPMVVVDARPLRSAMANEAMGAGYEEVEHYSTVEVSFMQIENIHEIRKSYDKMRMACERNSDGDEDWFMSLHNSKWIFHISRLLRAAAVICEIYQSGATVLVHCSDGWDRTPQCVSLAQLCLDRYYRTVEGFVVLIEKEWMEFGHRFADRLSFLKQSDEHSPIFIQFLDCVWQLCVQYPTAFEFSSCWLLQLIDLMLSGLYGNFLCNSVAERHQNQVCTKSRSLWSVLLTSPHRNPDFITADEPLVPIFQCRALSVWREYFFRNNALLCAAA